MISYNLKNMLGGRLCLGSNFCCLIQKWRNVYQCILKCSGVMCYYYFIRLFSRFKCCVTDNLGLQAKVNAIIWADVNYKPMWPMWCPVTKIACYLLNNMTTTTTAATNNSIVQSHRSEKSKMPTAQVNLQIYDPLEKRPIYTLLLNHFVIYIYIYSYIYIYIYTRKRKRISLSLSPILLIS